MNKPTSYLILKLLKEKNLSNRFGSTPNLSEPITLLLAPLFAEK